MEEFKEIEDIERQEIEEDDDKKMLFDGWLDNLLKAFEEKNEIDVYQIFINIWKNSSCLFEKYLKYMLNNSISMEICQNIIEMIASLEISQNSILALTILEYLLHIERLNECFEEIDVLTALYIYLDRYNKSQYQHNKNIIYRVIIKCISSYSCISMKCRKMVIDSLFEENDYIPPLMSIICMDVDFIHQIGFRTLNDIFFILIPKIENNQCISGVNPNVSTSIMNCVELLMSLKQFNSEAITSTLYVIAEIVLSNTMQFPNEFKCSIQNFINQNQVYIDTLFFSTQNGITIKEKTLLINTFCCINIDVSPKFIRNMVFEHNNEVLSNDKLHELSELNNICSHVLARDVLLMPSYLYHCLIQELGNMHWIIDHLYSKFLKEGYIWKRNITIFIITLIIRGNIFEQDVINHQFILMACSFIINDMSPDLLHIFLQFLLWIYNHSNETGIQLTEFLECLESETQDVIDFGSILEIIEDDEILKDDEEIVQMILNEL